MKVGKQPTISKLSDRVDIFEKTQADEFGMKSQIPNRLGILQPSEFIEAEMNVGMVAVIGYDVVGGQAAILLASHPLIVGKQGTEIGRAVEYMLARSMHVVPIAASGEDRLVKERFDLDPGRHRPVVAATFVFPRTKLRQIELRVDSHASRLSPAQELADKGQVPVPGRTGKPPFG